MVFYQIQDGLRISKNIIGFPGKAKEIRLPPNTEVSNNITRNRGRNKNMHGIIKNTKKIPETYIYIYIYIYIYMKPGFY